MDMSSNDSHITVAQFFVKSNGLYFVDDGIPIELALFGFFTHQTSQLLCLPRKKLATASVTVCMRSANSDCFFIFILYLICLLVRNHLPWRQTLDIEVKTDASIFTNRKRGFYASNLDLVNGIIAV